MVWPEAENYAVNITIVKQKMPGDGVKSQISPEIFCLDDEESKMVQEVINPKNVFKPRGYSHAFKVGNTIYAAG